MRKGFILLNEANKVVRKEDVKGPICGRNGFKHYFYNEGSEPFLVLATLEDAETIAQEYCGQSANHKALIYNYCSSFHANVVVERDA